ncbi:MAG: guanylate kinase [Chloroflexi bacterium]|nr:guanylate kinase [Chloroflexota bacterium]
MLVVLSGPSGVGKDAVLSRLRTKLPACHFTVTVTTRTRRPQERDGVDYNFVSERRFQELLGRGELLEYAQVYGNWYGVPKDQVREALARGRDVMIKADVQGAATIKRLAPQAVFIFLAPGSLEELESRLHNRHTESPEALAQRLQVAREEMKRLPEFDYIVVNADARMDQAIAQIEAIITAEKCRVQPRIVKL